MDYLENNFQYKNSDLVHLRTYYYTGEFTDQLIQRIETTIKKEENKENRRELEELLEQAKNGKATQTEFFKKAKNYYFFELRCKPLQFSPAKNSIFQKGVDVQLAVDLVDFTHKNVYDVVVLLSGDIDLIESIQTAKNLGKHIILFGDRSVTAEELKRNIDLFIDLNRLNESELDKFTHKPNN